MYPKLLFKLSSLNVLYRAEFNHRASFANSEYNFVSKILNVLQKRNSENLKMSFKHIEDSIAYKSEECMDKWRKEVANSIAHVSVFVSFFENTTMIFHANMKQLIRDLFKWYDNIMTIIAMDEYYTESFAGAKWVSQIDALREAIN